MSFAGNLIVQGVSRTGALEVMLGLPLSRQADRTVLTRVAPQAAMTSLQKPQVTSSDVAPSTLFGTTRKLVPKQVDADFMHYLLLPGTPVTMSIRDLFARWRAELAAEEAAKLLAAVEAQRALVQRAVDDANRRAEQIRTEMEIHHANGDVWSKFMQMLANGRPFWPWEWDRWHAQMALFRRQADQVRATSRTLAQRMNEVRDSLAAS